MKTADGLYGTVLVVAVLAALSKDPGAGAGELLGGVLVVMLVYWVVHVYAGTLALRVARPDRGMRGIMRQTMREEWPLVEAATVPAIPLVLGVLGVLGRDAALWCAIGAGLVDLFGWGWAVGRAARQPVVGAAALGALNVALGALMVGLKFLIK
jgi:hypothetical protein